MDRKLAAIVSAALVLVIPHSCFSSDGTCQDWAGTWTFTYAAATGAGACFDTASLQAGSISWCDNATVPNCQCIENATGRRVCIDSVTMSQCAENSSASCTCYDNLFYRNPSVAPGDYEVKINTARTNQTLGPVTFLCSATGTRTTDSRQIFIGQPDESAVALINQYAPFQIENGTYGIFEGSIPDITNLANLTNLTIALIPPSGFTSSTFTTSDRFNIIGLTGGIKGTAPEQCNLTVQAFAFPITPYIISAPRESGIAFAPTVSIDWGGAAIRDVSRLRIGDKLIFGFARVIPGQLANSAYKVTVTSGGGETACGSLSVRR